MSLEESLSSSDNEGADEDEDTEEGAGLLPSDPPPDRRRAADTTASEATVVRATPPADAAARAVARPNADETHAEAVAVATEHPGAERRAVADWDSAMLNDMADKEED